MKVKSVVKRITVKLTKLFPIFSPLRNAALNWTRRNLEHRRLEIGPGERRIPGFETLNVVASFTTDFIADASGRLPFRDNTFDVIYASHILEHIAWYHTTAALREWARILKPGGVLEIWVPNGLLISKALVDFEIDGNNYIHMDGWYRFNLEEDPCKWAAGRIFTYGDGSGNPAHPNWHRAIFTPRYLRRVLEDAGFFPVQELGREHVRGYDHGWINLGMSGIKRASKDIPSVSAVDAP